MELPSGRRILGFRELKGRPGIKQLVPDTPLTPRFCSRSLGIAAAIKAVLTTFLANGGLQT